MSTGWIETRIQAVEQRCEYLLRLVNDLTVSIRAAAQAARTASQQGYAGGGGSASTGAFFATPSGAVSGNSSFTSTVYQFSAGSSAAVAASATIYNNYPASLVASKLCFVVSDGAGNWVVVTQSCT